VDFHDGLSPIIGREDDQVCGRFLKDPLPDIGHDAAYPFWLGCQQGDQQAALILGGHEFPVLDVLSSELRVSVMKLLEGSCMTATHMLLL
jgi:hypothetical protein